MCVILSTGKQESTNDSARPENNSFKVVISNRE